MTDLPPELIDAARASSPSRPDAPIRKSGGAVYRAMVVLLPFLSGVLLCIALLTLAVMRRGAISIEAPEAALWAILLASLALGVLAVLAGAYLLVLLGRKPGQACPPYRKTP